MIEPASILFDSLFRPSISFIFFHLGKDHYSKQTKVAVFVLMILLPVMLFFLVGGAMKLLDLVDPVP